MNSGLPHVSCNSYMIQFDRRATAILHARCVLGVLCFVLSVFSWMPMTHDHRHVLFLECRCHHESRVMRTIHSHATCIHVCCMFAAVARPEVSFDEGNRLL